MKEVVARKAKSRIRNYVSVLVGCIAVSAGLLALFLLCVIRNGPWITSVLLGFFALVSAALAVSVAVAFAHWKSVPDEIVTREGEAITFRFAKGKFYTCTADKITNVSYERDANRSVSWGTLTVRLRCKDYKEVAEKKIRLSYVEDVAAAYEKLLAVLSEYKRRAEVKEEENAANREEE